MSSLTIGGCVQERNSSDARIANNTQITPKNNSSENKPLQNKTGVRATPAPPQSTPLAPFQPYEFANVSTQHPKGGSNGSVVMEEFVSFSCGVCARGRNLTDRALKRGNGALSLKYRHFPLPQTPGAYLAAQAFECAADQNKEWEIEGWLYSNPDKYDMERLGGMANESGMDARMFSYCLSSGTKRKIVDDDLAEAKARGINGTPYFVIGNGSIRHLLDDEDFLAEVFRLTKLAK